MSRESELIGARLERARKSQVPPMSQQEVADFLGIIGNTYRSYEYGRSKLPVELAKKLAAEWGLNWKYFFEPEEPVSNASGPYPLRATATGKVKIYGKVGAGDGNHDGLSFAEMDVPVELSRPDYGALTVDGDSMMPLLHHGDIVIFQDFVQPKIGYVMAAELPDKSWVVKLIAHTNGQFVLRSLNDRYEDYEGSYRLVGFLVGIIHDDGPERTIRLNPFGIKP